MEETLWFFFILASFKDNHRSLEVFEFLPDSTTTELAALEGLKLMSLLFLLLLI